MVLSLSGEMLRWKRLYKDMMSLKEEIKQIVIEGILKSYGIQTKPVIEIPPKPAFGDFASNISSFFPCEKKISFDDFMNTVVDKLSKKNDMFEKVLRKGGYVNFFLHNRVLFGRLRNVVEEGAQFGSSNAGNGKRILVEFVSANPTGPLNVVSARAGVVGDVLVKLLNFTGYRADAEFYINDAGRQMHMLGESAEIRFKELLGESGEIPEDGYKGEYIKDYVKQFLNDKKVVSMSEVERIQFFKETVKDEMVKSQKHSLERFDVRFKKWISEVEILKQFSVQQVLKILEDRGDVYKKDGAIWFSTTKYGDDKDRVLIKQNGTHTYIVSDASYHKNKFERGYEYLINLWGPDHHGDIMRLKAAIEAFGFGSRNLEIIIVQQVTLVSKGKKEKMSKRSGKFITLDSLLDSVDSDAVRFFFLMRRSQAHLDFDVELAKTLSLENPVYYTKYCHARTVNIFNFAREAGLSMTDDPDLSLLKEPGEREIARLVLLFPEVVLGATEKRDVHRVPYYLLDLAKAFHSYYQKVRVVTDDGPLSEARLFLVKAMQQVMKNGLDLIGVAAPEKM